MPLGPSPGPRHRFPGAIARRFVSPCRACILILATGKKRVGASAFDVQSCSPRLRFCAPSHIRAPNRRPFRKCRTSTDGDIATECPHRAIHKALPTRLCPQGFAIRLCPQGFAHKALPTRLCPQGFAIRPVQYLTAKKAKHVSSRKLTTFPQVVFHA